MLADRKIFLQLDNFLFRKVSMSPAFKAIAAEPRRRILNYLAGGPMTVGEIAAKFDMATPSISKHLSVLKQAGLVHEQKRGQFVIYSIAADNLTNTLYQFLSPFCPQARKIATQRKRERKDK
jgi:DNA-binding transcriptional ArsR family regulator